MIYVTGDMNGEQDRFFDDKTIRNLTSEDYLIICGGFEFITYDKNTIVGEIENSFLDELEELPYTILFVDGVNENFELLNAYPVESWNGGCVHRIRKNIAHLMRGQVFVIDGKKIFTMGGGRPGNINDYVSEMKTHDTAALPTSVELEDAWNNLEKHGSSVDMIVTHIATADAMTLNSPKRGRTLYVGDMMSFFENIIENIHYKKWYFGFLHSDLDRGLEYSPLGKYCTEKKMHPVWLDVLKVD